ncbi:MAG: hypothetical protein ACOYX5_20470, partial [Actinomycetota bacterium]
MARKNPVGKLAETAFSTLKDPKAAAEKVVEQAKGTVALGKVMAETAGSVAESVVQRATGRGQKQPTQRPAPVEVSRPAASEPGLRAVPDVNEPAATQAPAKPSGAPAKKQGDQLRTVPTKTAAPRKKPAASTPAKKAAASEPAKKTPTKKTPGAKSATAKQPV